MEELIALLNTIPYGTECMIAIGTATVIMTAVSPAVQKIVRWTSWKWDDRLVKKISGNKILQKVAWVGNQLSRFSLVK